jgi:hypothetical protein
MAEQLRGLFEKFVTSSYYSEMELRGGAVTVFFFFEVPSLASDAPHNAPPTSRKRAAHRWSLRSF